jgi:hypothetical protein
VSDERCWEKPGLKTFRDVDDLLEYYGDRLPEDDLKRLEAFIFEHIRADTRSGKRQVRR